MALTKVDKSVSSTPGIVDSSNATAITIDSSENVLIGVTSGSDPLVVSDSGASSITARFINTNADANPANIRLQKLSGSPADDDYIGMINVSGENDASEETIFQSIDFISTDVSDGSEDGVIAFRTRGAGTLAERLRITEQGFLKLSSKVSFSGTGDAGLGHHTNNYMYIYGGSAGLILQDNSGGSNRILLRDSNSIEFEVNGSQQAQFDSSGNFLINATSRQNTGSRVSIKPVGSGVAFETQPSDSNAYYVALFFNNSSAVVGSIYSSTSSTSFNTSSDYRLKENVIDMDNAINRVKQLKPKRFNFIVDADKTVDGFLAHEVSDIVPEAITGEKDGKEMQGIDQSKLVPLLTKAIQEQQQIIDDLKARIEVLEA